MDDGNTTTTRLLTLLNVSATRVRKRQRAQDPDVPTKRLNKRKTAKFADGTVEHVERDKSETVGTEAQLNGVNTGDLLNHESPAQDGDLNDEDDDGQRENPYERHFGMSPQNLTEDFRHAVDRHAWSTTKDIHGKLGSIVQLHPEGSVLPRRPDQPSLAILSRLWGPFQAWQAKQANDHTQLQNDVLKSISNYQDLYATSISLDHRQNVREAICLHSLNHVTKKRRRVLKNNERLAHAAKAEPKIQPPEDVQDQGFTRPSILFLLPFRSSAMSWMNALKRHTPSPAYQIENNARFASEYGLPPGAMDKLANADPGTYPKDHVETFKGNMDDNFRLGVKITRKSVKLFAEFYGCDMIFASPLGLRMLIEKEKHADFLSSIEVLIVDQVDVLTMQNWDHVQFLFENLNSIPKESHNTDFSRIKPWYLDGHSAYLRQTILLSTYETPETRALFNNNLNNVAGKLRTDRIWPAIGAPEGVEQSFIHFDGINPKDEPDKRFNYFISHVLPVVFKSAVQSANTVVFVPSSFDFIRVHNWFKKDAPVTFAVLSEYSSPQDISRARQAFFTGKKAFLLVSERFHFYRRYKIRGIRNVIFYGPPDHAQFYTEFLSYPFLDDDVHPSDVTCRLLYSKYDWFRMERLVGTEAALELIKGQ